MVPAGSGPPAPWFSATRSSPATSTTRRIRRCTRPTAFRARRIHPSPRGTASSVTAYDCPGLVDGANGDQIGTRAAPIDAKLGPLADYGGPTLTHALVSGSPAIDGGNPATPGSGGTACPTTDQRGETRPSGAACDVGLRREYRRRPDRGVLRATARPAARPGRCSCASSATASSLVPWCGSCARASPTWSEGRRVSSDR